MLYQTELWARSEERRTNAPLYLQLITYCLYLLVRERVYRIALRVDQAHHLEPRTP